MQQLQSVDYFFAFYEFFYIFVIINVFIAMFEEFLGKQVIIRSNDAGVFVGTLEEVDTTANGLSVVRLSKARNIWVWEGASCIMQVAEQGIRAGKVSQEVASIVILGVCQILLLKEVAQLSLDRIPAWIL